MKFNKFYFKNCLLFIIIFSLNNVICYSDKNTFETANLIKNELDNLIEQLESRNDDYLSLQPQSNQEFTDKIFDAFKSLDRDLVLYNDIITRSKRGGLKDITSLNSMFIKFDDKGNSRQCEVNPDVLKGNFYLDVQEITNQIEQSTGSLLKINNNDKQSKTVKEKLKLVIEIKKKLLLIKDNLNDINKKKIEVLQKIKLLQLMKKKLVSNKELLKRIKNNKLEVKRILELVSHRKKNLIKTKEKLKDIKINKYNSERKLKLISQAKKKLLNKNDILNDIIYNKSKLTEKLNLVNLMKKNLVNNKDQLNRISKNKFEIMKKLTLIKDLKKNLLNNKDQLNNISRYKLELKEKLNLVNLIKRNLNNTKKHLKENIKFKNEIKQKQNLVLERKKLLIENKDQLIEINKNKSGIQKKLYLVNLNKKILLNNENNLNEIRKHELEVMYKLKLVKEMEKNLKNNKMKMNEIKNNRFELKKKRNLVFDKKENTIKNKEKLNDIKKSKFEIIYKIKLLNEIKKSLITSKEHLDEITINKSQVKQKINFMNQKKKKILSSKNKLNDIEHIKFEIEQKLNSVSNMKKRLLNIKDVLSEINNKKFEIKRKLGKIHLDITSLINIIDNYKHKEKIVRIKLDEDLLKIKDELHASKEKTMKVENYIKILHEMEDYLKKLNQTENNSNEFNTKIYDSYIQQISRLEIQSFDIKKKLDQQIQNMNNMDYTSPVIQRVRKLIKVEKIIKRLIKSNKKNFHIKKSIIHKLKKISFRNLYELMLSINKKKNITQDKHSKLVHFRNAIQIGKQIFNDKSKVEDVKKTILENLRKAHKNIVIKKEQLVKLKQKLNETISIKPYETYLIVNITNLFNVKSKLIKRYVTLFSFVKELKKLRVVLKEPKDRIELNEKINITYCTMKQIKLLIISIKKLILDFKNNHDIKHIQIKYTKLINEIRQLKMELNNDQNIDNKRLEEFRSKLNKLSNIYKYLKKGNLHNFVLMEIFKKIVNIDLNIQGTLALKKLKKEVELINK